MRPHTIKTCWTALIFDSRAVPVLDYPLITQPEQPGTRTSAKTIPGNTARKTVYLVILPETKLPQPTWRIGSTQWAGGHLHQALAIDGVPPQIGFPPLQILPHYHPKSQNSGLETHNRLEATSRQKLAKDGTSPKIALTRSVRLTTNHHKLNQIT